MLYIAINRMDFRVLANKNGFFFVFPLFFVYFNWNISGNECRLKYQKVDKLINYYLKTAL